MRERHARQLLEEYLRSDDTERSHQALESLPPLVEREDQVVHAPVLEVLYLGGLHHGYLRAD